MTERMILRLALASATGLWLLSGALALWGHAKLGLGLFAGSTWNAVNLWCLARLLNAWLKPPHSTRAVIGWLLVKFPLLYVAVFWLLSQSLVSVLGFGVGFTIVLVAVMAGMAIRAPQLMTPVPHDPTT